jgi:hypothetical protein
MRYCCAILLTLISIFATYAKTTVIYGNAPSYAGKMLSIRVYSDEVLHEEDELDRTTVQPNGDFKFEVEINSVVNAFIPTEVERAFIYLEPGATYHISIPPYRERTLSEKLDPYFAPKDYLASIVGLKKGDFNYQMMEFEDAFDFYSMKHVTYGANPDSVKKSIRELRRIFSDLKNPYQKRFKEYRYVLLQNMSVPSYPKMQDSVIRRLNVLGPDYDNPAFWDAFNNVFEGFIGNTIGSEDYELFKKLVNDGKAKLLLVMLRERYGITNPYLCELAAIKMVGDLTDDPAFDLAHVIAMLKAMKPLLPDADNRDLLQAMVNKASADYIGTPAPDFEAYNADGKSVKLSDYKGKLVYLNFCNSNIEQTLRDVQVLERFHDSYQHDLAVLNVFLYDDAATVKRLQSICKGQVCLTTPVPDAVRHAYQVSGVPSYMLIDRQGNFMMTRGAEPNDQFRLFLQNLLQRPDGQ